jgi:hypothetical protein
MDEKRMAEIASETLTDMINFSENKKTEELVKKAREFAKGFLIGYLEDREDIHWVDDLWYGYDEGTDINFYWDDVLRQQHATLYFVEDCEGNLKEDRYRLDDSIDLF